MDNFIIFFLDLDHIRDIRNMSDHLDIRRPITKISNPLESV